MKRNLQGIELGFRPNNQTECENSHRMQKHIKIPDVQFKTDTWAARNRQESHDTCSGPVHFPYWPSGPCALCHDGECDWHSLESDRYNDCKDKRERRGQKGEKKKKEGWERRDGGGELVTGTRARERNNPDKRDCLIRGWWNETSDNGDVTTTQNNSSAAVWDASFPVRALPITRGMKKWSEGWMNQTE